MIIFQFLGEVFWLYFLSIIYTGIVFFGVIFLGVVLVNVFFHFFPEENLAETIYPHQKWVDGAYNNIMDNLKM